MPFKFSLPQLGKATGNEFNEESLRLVGIELASNNLPDDHMFSRMGGWNVTFRASVVRITFFKLLGLGLVAAFMATSPHVGAFTAWSLTMSAAINLVACGHYWYIWNVRAQTYRLPKYDKWMAKIPRRPAGTPEGDEQDAHDKHAIYFQEVTTDGLRYSDWLVTLVLLALDLGHLREYLYYATAGVIPEMPVAKEWLATFQALMIFFASVYRFYCNEGRSVLEADGKKVRPASWLTVTIAWVSFVLAMVFFLVVVWGLLDGLPDDAAMDAAMFPSHIKADVYSMRVLVLIWLGYPLVTLAARLGHWGKDGDEYSATWSVFKDIMFAFLDVTSKSGLALYFVLKASWVSGAAENALVAVGKTALNVTV